MPSIYIRPTSTVTTSAGWTAVGAGSYQAATDEDVGAVNVVDYMLAAVSGDYTAELGFGDLPDGFGAAVSATLSMAYSSSGRVDDTVLMTAKLKSAAAVDWSSEITFLNNANAAAVTTQHLNMGLNSTGLAAPITDWNDVVLALRRNKVNSMSSDTIDTLVYAIGLTVVYSVVPKYNDRVIRHRGHLITRNYW